MNVLMTFVADTAIRKSSPGKYCVNCIKFLFVILLGIFCFTPLACLSTAMFGLFWCPIVGFITGVGTALIISGKVLTGKAHTSK